MEMEKTSIAIKVYIIAEQYDIPRTVVKSIISSYIDYCKDLILHGERVDFIGLVSVVPDVQFETYNSTLAYECMKLSDRLGIPYNTVFIIIREYINGLIDELLEVKTVEIRGIVTMKPYYENGIIGGIHASISTSIKKALAKIDSPVSSVRVHTHKLLKYNLQQVNSKVAS